MTTNSAAPEKDSTMKTPASLEPSIATFGINAGSNCALYDNWATSYESDVRQWGYTVPEEVATLLSQYVHGQESILDAGSGDGLSGQALRQSGISGHMTAIDISSNMLKMAQQRGCYNQTQVVNLSQPPLPFADHSFHVVVCVGTLTHLDPRSATVSEFVRVCKPGGYICYTNRTDKMADFEKEERQLEKEGKWKLIKRRDPLPYLPGNPDYGDEIRVVIQLYQTPTTMR